MAEQDSVFQRVAEMKRFFPLRRRAANQDQHDPKRTFPFGIKLLYSADDGTIEYVIPPHWEAHPDVLRSALSSFTG